MISWKDFIPVYTDSCLGHIVLVIFLFAILDELSHGGGTGSWRRWYLSCCTGRTGMRGTERIDRRKKCTL